MAKPNPRYQLYDIVEDRPPDRGRGNPMNNIGRREVCGLVPDTFKICPVDFESMANPVFLYNFLKVVPPN